MNALQEVAWVWREMFGDAPYKEKLLFYICPDNTLRMYTVPRMKILQQRKMLTALSVAEQT